MMHEIERLAELMSARRTVVLTGAGCSTESGIPDYRGPASQQRTRKPIQYQEFVRSEEARRRYWARSVVGWQRVAAARPNPAHVALASLEQHGAVAGIITQNVDGLHHAAGSQNIVELHGSLAFVRCVDCNLRLDRARFQQRLSCLNPDWAAHDSAQMLPDGDADLDDDVIAAFVVPSCDCGGTFKPDVVFFGENVSAGVLQSAWDLLDDGEALLVCGSSLTVYSGRRFVYRAQQHQKPVAIINMGATRSDEVAAIKLDAPVGAVLPRLAGMIHRKACGCGCECVCR